jgi:acyl-CoA thioester hydrolase
VLPQFHHPLRVRYADTDAQGHVYFSNYLTYADEGLSAFMRHIGWSSERTETEGIDFVFADARSTYQSRAYFEDLLHVHVGVERVGTTSLVWQWTVHRPSDDTVLASGHLVQVCIAMPQGEKTPLPNTLKHDLTEWMV